MPIYRYRASSENTCPYCGPGFELLQRLSDERLETCPRCRAPVEKQISPVNLVGSISRLNEDTIERHGFTQYRKLEKGKYEKTAGKGPALIGDEDS